MEDRPTDRPTAATADAATVQGGYLLENKTRLDRTNTHTHERRPQVQKIQRRDKPIYSSTGKRAFYGLLIINAHL